MSNFSFLKESYPNLARLGELAEKYLYYDSNTTFIKLGLLCESMIDIILNIEELKNYTEKLNQYRRIKYLSNGGILKDQISCRLHDIRRERNKASHNAFESISRAKEILRDTYKVTVWFMKVYVDYSFKEEKFVMPKKEEQISKEELDLLDKKYTREIDKYKDALEEIKALTEKINRERWVKEREERNKKAVAKLSINKTETRNIVEEQLRVNGWEADFNRLNYSKNTRPKKHRCMAIAKWPVKSGFVDYALFCGEMLVGFVMFEKYSTDISNKVLTIKNYSEEINEEHIDYCAGKWNKYRVPFLFVANGREYIDEIKEKSGVYFLDCRDENNEIKILQNWYTPDNILELLEKNINEANDKLEHMSFDLLKATDGLSLRYYQLEAVKKVENSIKNGENRALLTMATGTGKTRTVLGMIYRFLAAKRFKRILFLVDRKSLAEQALEVFEEVKIKDFLTLNQIYNINGLEDKNIEKETKIHVATIQAMVRNVIYSEEDDMPGVGDYDLIVVDEVHRGYTLDRELEEDELFYKDHKDFISKYKKVIDYFDAVKIGLTATPALHTIQIFGAPVYRYTYRQAVIDGYLVDHEPPHIIKTNLSDDGIHLKKGQTIKLLNNETEILEDDLDFDVDDFNRSIIVESHTRAALQEVAKYIDLDEKGKTLIFAASDLHADIIVKILKEIYFDKISEDSIAKITAKSDNVELAIKKLKNEKEPKIAVTVDLLTTGIDIPMIDKLVFLRRVKSRILYEQMLGRATRLCDDIDKTHFEIYDCVNLYEALQSVSDMKPVVVDSKESFTKLRNQLEIVNTDEDKKAILNKIIAKLQRKKKSMKDDILFELYSKKNIVEFITYLKNSEMDEAIDFIINNNQLVEYLDNKKIKSKEKVVVIEEKDRIVEHTRGYGGNKKPEDYINEFETYIKENMNKIVSLNILCTRPKDMTRNDLKALKSILDGEGFSEEYLKTAYRDMTNQDITADIVAFIRQKAIGSALISREERVSRAMNRIKREFKFNESQLKYLKKIEKYMIKEVIIDNDVFEMGNFKRDGGFKRYNTIFEDNLNLIIQKIKEYMFDELA